MTTWAPTPTEVPKRQTYWYMTTTVVCVNCGTEKVYRERVYDRPKPVVDAERFDYIEELCYGCLV